MNTLLGLLNIILIIVCLCCFLFGIFENKKRRANKLKALDVFDVEIWNKSVKECHEENKNSSKNHICNELKKQSEQITELQKRIIHLENVPKFKGKVTYKGEVYRILETEICKRYKPLPNAWCVETVLEVKYKLLHNKKDIQIEVFESDLKK